MLSWRVAGGGAASKALVVAEVEVRLRAIVGHEHLAVLIGRHRLGVDVGIGIELGQPHLVTARLQQRYVWRGLTKADRAGVKPSRDKPTPQAARRRAFQRQFSGFCPRRSRFSMIWNRLKVPYCDTKLGRLSNGPRNATWEVAMAKKKRHSRAEIATKLAEANDLATQGKLQSEIARTLGVSLMTLHRWRKAQPGPQPALVATAEAREPDRIRLADDRIAELQLENSRLRRLVTDLLLEKVKLEEAAQGQSSVA